jgi:hypothetical protein
MWLAFRVRPLAVFWPVALTLALQYTIALPKWHFVQGFEPLAKNCQWSHPKTWSCGALSGGLIQSVCQLKLLFGLMKGEEPETRRLLCN